MNKIRYEVYCPECRVLCVAEDKEKLYLESVGVIQVEMVCWKCEYEFQMATIKVYDSLNGKKKNEN